MLAAPTADLVARFADIVGPAHALTKPVDQQSYLTEWRDLYVGRTPVVLLTGSADIDECDPDQLGVAGLVRKPFPFAAVMDLVNRYLELK